MMAGVFWHGLIGATCDDMPAKFVRLQVADDDEADEIRPARPLPARRALRIGGSGRAMNIICTRHGKSPAPNHFPASRDSSASV